MGQETSANYDEGVENCAAKPVLLFLINNVDISFFKKNCKTFHTIKQSKNDWSYIWSYFQHIYKHRNLLIRKSFTSEQWPSSLDGVVLFCDTQSNNL